MARRRKVSNAIDAGRVAEPLAQLIGPLRQALREGNAGDARLPHGAVLAHGPQIFVPGGRRRDGFFL